MLVIHIIPKFTKSIWGGAESIIVDLIKSYPPEIKSEVWTCKTPFDARKEEVIEGVRVRRFWAFYLFRKNMIGVGKPGIPPGLLAEVLRLPEKSEPVILHLHVHNVLSSLSILVGNFKKNIKSILTLHSLVSNHRPLWRYYFSNSFAIKYATKVIAVSEIIAEQAKRVTGRKDIEVIPNGIDLDWLEKGDRQRGRNFLKLALDHQTKILLFVGRKARVKNLEVLLKAFASLPENHRYRLVLVGPEAEPDYENYLRDVAFHLGVGDYVIFVGALPHKSNFLADLYAASDVVVMPSTFEAFSLAVLESWGAGRPVVVADVGGMGAMVRKWGAGFIWSPNTGVEGLTYVLWRALNESYKDIEDKIRRARAHYTAQKMTKQYVNIYYAVSSC